MWFQWSQFAFVRFPRVFAKCSKVYILANHYHGGAYIEVTSNLVRRVYQREESVGSINVADYGKRWLINAERQKQIEPAIAREKLVNNWKRPWKHALVEVYNPDWRDLWDEWFPNMPPK